MKKLIDNEPQEIEMKCIVHCVQGNGKELPPLEYDPLPPYIVILSVGQVAHVLKQGYEPVEGQHRYVSHFVTCKNAASHRRKKAVSS